MSSAKPTPDAPDGFLSRWSRRKVQARGGTLEAEAPAAPAAGRASEAATAAPGPSSTDAPTAGRGVSAAATGAAPPEAASGRRTDFGETPAAAPPAPQPPPTLDDVARLTKDSDYARFVGKGVDPNVKNAALHKLFADPHFNVMDGLDIYIDDYGRPDPLPAGMLEKMVQSEALGRFAKTPEPGDGPAPGAGVNASGHATDHPTGHAPSAAPDPAPDPAPGADARAAPDPTTDPLAAAPADSPRQPEEARAHEDPDLRLQPHHAAGTAEPAGPDGHGAAGPGQDPGRQR
jgi:hypothetical protein